MHDYFNKLFQIVSRNRRYILIGTIIYGTGFLIGNGLGFFTGTIDASMMSLDRTGASLRISDITLTDILYPNAFNIIVMTLGSVLLGIITIMLGFKNGFTHGVIVGTSIVGSGRVDIVALFFLPHAIIELPAIWIGIAAGIKIPSEFIKYLIDNGSKPIEESDLVDTMVLFLFAEVLVVVGAVVEYCVTFSFIRLV